MKKIIISAILAVIILLAPLVTITALTFTAPMQYDDTFLGELTDKHNRLKSIDEPKIVLIGGSSLAFGLDSALLEEYTGMPVVNYGLYATIGTKAMMDMSRAYINEGDIVVLCPETDAQTYSLYYNARSMWQALDCDLSMFWDVGFSNLGKLISTIPEFSTEKLGFVRNGSKPAPSGIYAHESFNEYGDIEVERLFNEMPTFYDTSMEISLTPELVDSEFVEFVNDYADHCHRRGASVYFSFSPINEAAVVSSDEEKEAFYKTLGESLNFPLLSDIDTYILDANNFYDTNFHLTTRGAKLRTALLADDLLRVLGKSERVETIKYTSVKRPDNFFDLLFEDDENSKYFEFETIEGGLAIVGLTDEGKTQTTLTIPRGYNGKAVLSLGDNAFAESTVLETVIVGELSALRGFTLEALSGTTSLKRIELYVKPSQLVLDEAIAGKMPADCYFYVKEDSYGDFATDYFWSALVKRIKTMK